MQIAERSTKKTSSRTSFVRGSQPRRLHRLADVRKEQGISQRSVARQMRTDLRSVRSQEDETADLRLSDLYRWQKVLGVPMADLIEDPGDDLSGPIEARANMVRLMKTAAAMLERAESPRMRRMAQTMVDQLIEIMPELKEVSPWHAVGQRRSLEEYGRVTERLVADEAFCCASQSEDY